VNLLFVNYHDFRSNSAIHIFNLARELRTLGVSCAVCVPARKETISDLGVPSFSVLDFADARDGRFGFSDGRGPDLIHAWTPREGVRRLTLELSDRWSAQYVVHLEDNEDAISADQLGIARGELHATSSALIEHRLTDTISHPARSREFLSGAIGISIIIEALSDFVPDGVPSFVLSPAYEEHLFAPQAESQPLRGKLGLGVDEHVVVYAGNVHPTNAAEVRSLYLAVALVNRRGIPLRLVRLGRDYANFLGEDAELLLDRVVHVDFRPRSELPSYYALADAFVQPGRSSEFNDYRIPSKLPEFFAMGRPVILPNANVGRSAKNGEECLLLDEGDALDIAVKLERLLHDEALRRRLGEGGRRFAERHFSWPRSAARLRDFYREVTKGHPGVQPDLSETVERYRPYTPQRPLSYATVRDFCDSVDHLPALAGRSRDLKDVQRPWALKAILGTVPIGARLLEIGAGDPYVADVLARIGYDITIVDPYDGRDRGPSSFESISQAYPHLRFVQGVFPVALGDQPQPFDCIFSVSVLEHVPDQETAELWEGIRRLTVPGGVTIHAIDHVHKGAGAPEHRAHLETIVSLAGIPRTTLDEILHAVDDDADTYFLSAEGHNLWRGSQPYDAFPMRRCVSIQLCVQPV